MATVPCIDDARGVSVARVLVVEDFEPFRRSICSKLGENPELLVIGEASDGLESCLQSGRTATGLGIAGHRTSETEWNRGRSTASQTCPEIQNNFRDSGIFC